MFDAQAETFAALGRCLPARFRATRAAVAQSVFDRDGCFEPAVMVGHLGAGQISRARPLRSAK